MAISILSCLFFLLLVIANYRRHLHRLAEQKFIYRLFSIRDKLRRYAIEGKIDEHSTEFDFLDQSISKAINEFYYITLFRQFVLMRKHHNDSRYKKVYDDISEASLKIAQLNELKNDYEQAVWDYMRNQHALSIAIINPVILFLGRAKEYKGQIKEITQSVFYLPETSATDRILNLTPDMALSR